MHVFKNLKEALLEAQEAFLGQGWEDVTITVQPPMPRWYKLIEQGWDDVLIQAIPGPKGALCTHRVRFLLSYGIRRYDLQCRLFEEGAGASAWSTSGRHSYEAARRQFAMERAKQHLASYKVHDELKPIFHKSSNLASFEDLRDKNDARVRHIDIVYLLQHFGLSALTPDPAATPSSHFTSATMGYMPPTIIVKNAMFDASRPMTPTMLSENYFIAHIVPGGVGASLWANVIG